MALRTLSHSTFTPTATADTTNLVDGTHLSIQGSTATERNLIPEIYMGGQATGSAINNCVFARHSTVGITLSLGTNCRDAALDGSSATGTARGYNTATTKPQRSSTLHLLELSFNAFGGVMLWRGSEAPGKQLAIVGNTASLGEAGLSAFTGGSAGAMSAHIVYEPL
jgi:hypothetical protein